MFQSNLQLTSEDHLSLKDLKMPSNCSTYEEVNGKKLNFHSIKTIKGRDAELNMGESDNGLASH